MQISKLLDGATIGGRTLAAAALILGICVGLMARPPSAMAAQAVQIWLAGAGPGGHLPGAPDYVATFEPGAPWARAAAVTNVFKVSTNFLAHAPDQTLAAVINGLRQRHIALAMAGLMLQGGQTCGRGVEGYTGPGVLEKIVSRVRSLGGTIAYLAMDEPVYFGHTKVAPNTCNDSLDSLAAQIAPKIRLFRDAFPGIVIGDIEPLTNATNGSLDTILMFAAAFKRATGVPLSFIHADVGWHSDYQPQLELWRERLHDTGMRLGVICHGDPNVDSDQAWASQAIERYRSVASDPATRPDDVIFQSWMVRPTYMLPDDQFGTMTSIVARAIASP